MMPVKPRIILITIMICLNNGIANIFAGENGQGRQGQNEIEDIYNEKYYLMTDRTIYAAGERILFKVCNVSPLSIKSINWSRVLYLELTKNDGTPVQKGKYLLGLSGCDGYIEIPAKISSGYYYLRAYTKWMRNFSVSAFAFCRVKIINPFSSKVLERKDAENGAMSYTESFIDESLSERIINCYTDKPKYTLRERVVLSVELPDYDPYLHREFCVSVVKTGAIDTMNFGMISFNQQENNNMHVINYIPDIRGVSVSGRVVKKESGIPVTNTRVQLSVLGNQFDFLEYNTGSDGKFLFSLPPLHGNADMYIAALSGNIKPEILIDNDFAAEAFYIEGEEFRLSDTEKDIAEEIILNMQIEKIYTTGGIPDSSVSTEDILKTKFYGKPSTIVYIDEYIELPTIEEVLFELVPEVIVRRRKGNIFINVTDNEINHPDLAIFEPLVLLDHVPVYNLENMLKLSPAKISRIEVINEIYIKGSSIYGGIISIYSLKGDIAGVDLPENSLFFDFQTFTEQDKIIFPDYSKNKGDLNMPDYRSCLYWNPNLKLGNNMKAGLEFYTSDRTGEYLVLVRYVNESGKIIEGKCFFEVE
jgi:hypothetical protein